MKLFCLVGPTGIGKTEVAIELAKKYDLDIISADSRQIYQYMDIGTAKPFPEVRDQVTFHLIDIIKPDILYSAADFAKDATKIIKEYLNANILPPSTGGNKREGDIIKINHPHQTSPVQGRGIIKQKFLPIIVGGAGLYLKALFEPFFSAPARDIKLRERLEKEPLDKLYIKLKQVDPVTAQRIKPQDRQRIIRALEIYQQTRKPMSEQIQEKPQTEFTPYYVGINMDRKLLVEKINQRFDDMIEKGLVNEVKHLLQIGYSEKDNALNGIGYFEIIRFLNQEISLMEVIYLAKIRSRQYAKRQLTWFKKVQGINWIEFTTLNETVLQVSKEYEKYLKSIK